jgi:hypothetical protein
MKLELFRYQVAISIWIFGYKICESCIRSSDFVTFHGALLTLQRGVTGTARIQ